MTQPGKTGTRKKTAKDTGQQKQVELTTWSDQPEWRSNCLLLTNRYNLLDILSSGLIKPASLYKKYYADAGAVCPEGIPLFLRDPCATFIENVMGVEVGTFPVLLEIDLREVYGTILAIRDDYQLEQAELPVEDRVIAIVAGGVIPTSWIRAAYFRSTSELEEHLAREYENVRDDAVQMHVSPERFAGPTVDVDQLLGALIQTGAALSPLPHEVFSGADALGGALLMLGGLTTRDADTALSILIPPLEALQPPTGVVEALAARGEDARVSGWLALLPSLLLEEPQRLSGAEEIADSFTAVVESLLTADDFADFLLFVATVQTLVHTPPEEFYHMSAFERIRAEFERQLTSALREESNQLRQYRGLLDTIQAILHNRMDLADFPFSQPSSVAALLLFLLRNEPVRALSWLEEKPRPSPEALAITAAFSGILYGRALIPLECRPDASLEQYIDDMIANRLSTVIRGIVVSNIPGKVHVESTDTPESRCEVLRVSGRILSQREIRVSNRDDMAPQVSEIREDALQRLNRSDLKHGVERAAAIYLCSLAGWDDCVTTSIQLEGRRYVLNASDPQKPELRISGFLTQAAEISIHVDRFRKRLTPEVWNRLPEQIRSEVEEALREGDHPLSGQLWRD